MPVIKGNAPSQRMIAKDLAQRKPITARYGKKPAQRTLKDDPASNAFFVLEVDGVRCGFAKARGVAAEVEVHSYQEGGVNGFEHRLPTRTTFSNITLERGTTKSKDLLKWFSQVREGILVRKDFSVILWNRNNEVVRRWDFKRGYPVKWSIGDLDALGNQILIESVELAHEGFSES